MFAARCKRTRFPSLRGEGQQIYFYAAVYAVVLVAISRFLIVVAEFLSPAAVERFMHNLWTVLAGSLGSSALPTFFTAFVLGYVGADIVNCFSDDDRISAKVIEVYGGQLDKFLYDAIFEAQLLFVVLGNGKVYVGWATDVPMPKPRREDIKEHFKFLPTMSGYLDDKLQPQFTTQYGAVFDKVVDEGIANLDIYNFEIVIPLDEVMVLREYSLDVQQDWFKMPRS